MREINVSEVEELVRDLCIKANLYLPEDMESCIECNAKKEQSPVGKNVFADILDNMRVAREETIPICPPSLSISRTSLSLICSLIIKSLIVVHLHHSESCISVLLPPAERMRPALRKKSR